MWLQVVLKRAELISKVWIQEPTEVSNALLFEGSAQRKPVASHSRMGGTWRTWGVYEVRRSIEDSVFLATSWPQTMQLIL